MNIPHRQKNARISASRSLNTLKESGENVVKLR